MAELRGSINKILVLLNILMLILLPVTTAIAANDNGNSGGNGGGNSGNGNSGGNGGGNSGNGNSGGNGGGNPGNGNSGGNGGGNPGNGNSGGNGGGNPGNGNSGGTYKGNNGNGGEDRGVNGKDSGSMKRAKDERKSVREAKLGRIKAKNDKLRKHVFGNKSKNNPRDPILKIPLTDESPYILKMEAYEKVRSFQGEDSRFVRIADLMGQSISENLWLDYFRVPSPGAFNYDMYAAREVMVMIDRQKTSPLPAEDLEYVLFKLVQADKMLAYTGIQDTKNLIERMPEDQSIEFERHLDNAIERFSKADEDVEDGAYLTAIRQYNNAWNESSGYLIQYGTSLPPQIFIETQASDSYVNSSMQRVAGRVLDIMLSRMESVNITIDGRTSAAPLIDGTFETEATLKEGLNTIEAGALNYFGNAGTERINVTLDTIPPDIILTDISSEGRHTMAANATLNFYQRRNITIDADVTEANPDSISVRIDGRELSSALPYHLNTALYPDGGHTIEIYAFDKAGNTDAEVAKFNFDNAAPEIIITSPLNASFVSGAVVIEGAVKDANLLASMVTVDGMAVYDTLPYLLNTFAYSDGSHTIRMEAADRAGNRASKEIIVTVNNTRPGAEIKFPPVWGIEGSWRSDP